MHSPGTFTHLTNVQARNSLDPVAMLKLRGLFVQASKGARTVTHVQLVLCLSALNRKVVSPWASMEYGDGANTGCGSSNGRLEDDSSRSKRRRTLTFNPDVGSGATTTTAAAAAAAASAAGPSSPLSAAASAAAAVTDVLNRVAFPGSLSLPGFIQHCCERGLIHTLTSAMGSLALLSPAGKSKP